MPTPAVISYAAAYFSLIVALGVLLRDRDSFVHRVFATGILLFAAEELLRGLSFGAVLPDDAAYWQKRMAAVSVLLPAVWLAFSLSYGRVNSRISLSRWKWPLLAMLTVPMAFVVVFRKTLFLSTTYLESTEQWSILLGWPGRALQVFVILASVMILVNLEQTVRSSTGRLRWQIKFMILGVAGLFALRIYLASHSLLYSTVETGFITINPLVLLAANFLFAASLLRGSSLNVDVYLSTATIQNSLTVLLAGMYLIAVGLFARIARVFSGSLPLDAFAVFIGLTALVVLLLSNRLRRKIRLFVGRHFRRPAYDYRNVWMELTKRTTLLVDINELSTAISRMVSDSLDILSVSVWLVDDTQRRLMLAGSTAIPLTHAKQLERAGRSAPEFIRRFRENSGCIDLDNENLSWPKEVMQAIPDIFRTSRMRYGVSLYAGGELAGVMTLNDDRVGHEELTEEDFTFLETVSSQLAASLLNLRLSGYLRHAKEVETFQTVSTFFVHDLKNLASRLSLTMHNLPGNFDNPEFRADALRVIATSVKKIDDMCERLAMLKQSIELKPAECDLNRLVQGTLEEFKGSLKAELKQDLQPVPTAFMDSEQIRKVLTNLIMNANEAVNGDGLIEVSTIQEGSSVALSVRDNGCGIPADFIEKSLFRPFQTTKKKGLGIGLFHCKLIVEAHRGTLEVNSAVGTGTEFKVILPINN